MQRYFNDSMMTIARDCHGQSMAIAVSGGADSMALLLLADRWARTQGGKAIALTVDHGLRKESKNEAAQVGLWCGARGIEHHILAWQSPRAKPADARNARYALLSDWCKAHGVETLITAHHRGDQAETLFFRLARGSTLRGLACIPKISQAYGLRLLRPLLGVSKKSLVEYLQSEDQPWIEDPSNQNTAYTRNAIRAQLQSLPDADAIEARAAAVAESLARFRHKLDAKIHEAFTLATHRTAEGEMTIRAAAFSALPSELGLLLLGEFIHRLTGDDHPPRTVKLERLQGWLLAPDSRQTTLAHLVFTHVPQKGLFKVAPQTEGLK